MNAALSFDVAIVGAGPAGIGAALALSARGVQSICLVERGTAVGGIPARYGDSGRVPTFIVRRRGRIVHGGEYARELDARLSRTRVRVLLETQVVAVDVTSRTLTAVGPELGRCQIAARAHLFTTGAREQSGPERGWIAGARPGRVLFTLQLIDLLRHAALPGRYPIVLGSDLIGYAAAAKLADAGAATTTITDASLRPTTALAARLFFRRWARSTYWSAAGGVAIDGEAAVDALTLGEGQSLACDTVVLSGSLTPQSELLVQAGLAVAGPRKVPVASRSGALSAPGFFAAGNLLGGFRGAEWCYRSGKRVGAAVVQYLASAG